MSRIVQKLKVFPISDLHLEFYQSATSLYNTLKPKLPDADVLVLAGDIGYPTGIPHRKNYVELLNLFKTKYEHVILVAGNHEYYQSKFHDRETAFQALNDICRESKVQLLEKSSVNIRGVTFLGTTLWSAVDAKSCKQMNDFKDAFKSQVDYLEEFIDSFKWLRTELSLPLMKEQSDESKLTKNIVITHHLPSDKLIHRKYQGHPANSGFATNLLGDLPLHNTSLWICGHSHEHMSINYGDTKLVLNPYGYPHEQETRETKLSTTVYEV